MAPWEANPEPDQVLGLVPPDRQAWGLPAPVHPAAWEHPGLVQVGWEHPEAVRTAWERLGLVRLVEWGHPEPVPVAREPRGLVQAGWEHLELVRGAWEIPELVQAAWGHLGLVRPVAWVRPEVRDHPAGRAHLEGEEEDGRQAFNAV